MQITLFPETWRSANQYLISRGTRHYLIDPSHPPEKTTSELTLLLATHGHFDHIAAIDQWREGRDLELVISEEDQKLLADPHANCSELFRLPQSFSPAERLFAGDSFELEEGLELKVYPTPGHTAGSLTFLLTLSTAEEVVYEDNEGHELFSPLLTLGQREEAVALFTGDTLFAYSIGRTDLPTGSDQEMTESLRFLKRFLETLPSELPLLPGHGQATTVGVVRESHPYLLQI